MRDYRRKTRSNEAIKEIPKRQYSFKKTKISYENADLKEIYLSALEEFKHRKKINVTKMAREMDVSRPIVYKILNDNEYVYDITLVNFMELMEYIGYDVIMDIKKKDDE